MTFISRWLWISGKDQSGVFSANNWMKTNDIFYEVDLEMKVKNSFIIVYVRCDYYVIFSHRTVSTARIHNSSLLLLGEQGHLWVHLSHNF